MRKTSQGLGSVFGIIAVIVLPTAMMLGWFLYTRDPNLRPLGLTREALRDSGGFRQDVGIVAHIDGPRVAGERLGLALRASFESKGVELRLVFRENGDATTVTYVIGKSVLGPYPRSRAAEGIAAAVAAFRMY
ncbi:MAG: hypothetical protein CSA74_05160 [Rhodobacterales bacterium]|nr:MAG: hypothetical protein CSA74_05160 [Rhodobacterales bacterium]